MVVIVIYLTIVIIWISYEIWRAPIMEETIDGDLITKRATKKLSDLWRKEF